MRRTILGLTLTLVSLALALVLGELALRLASPGRYYVWEPGIRKIFRPMPSIMPGIQGESRFFINEHGLRGDPFSPDQGYRILAVGGSTTECLYLDQTEAWPRLLQERLNAGSGRRVWVGNVGKSGQMTRNHLVQVETLTRQYPRIDAVLLLAGVNDLMRRLKEEDRPTTWRGNCPGTPRSSTTTCTTTRPGRARWLPWSPAGSPQGSRRPSGGDLPSRARAPARLRALRT